MGHLHRGFAGGAMAAESLRAAQRELIGAHGAAASVATRGVGGLAPRGEAAPADTSHPYYWAGFEVFGALQ
jgi:CHAT domain-containing protein